MELGVCSWVIDRNDPQRAIRWAGEEPGVSAVQIGFFTDSSRQQATPESLSAAAQRAGITIVSLFAAFEREDYSSIESIANTGGLLPDHEYANRLKAIEQVAELATALGCNQVATHIGTVPSDAGKEAFATLVSRTQQACDRVSPMSVALHLETGRESAKTLSDFIEAVDRENVSVNFDPANFVVYGTDDPIQAMAPLKKRITGVHIKDATQSMEPGVAWGKSAPLGQGDTQIARVLSKLRTIEYAGPILIESRSADGNPNALRHAVAYLQSMMV